jgi:hypothetical protein
MRYRLPSPILDLGPYARDVAASIMSSMNDHAIITERTDRGRYMLLPEETTAATPPADPQRPRIRRYRLARMPGDGGAPRSRRPSGDFSYLGRAHD